MNVLVPVAATVHKNAHVAKMYPWRQWLKGCPWKFLFVAQTGPLKSGKSQSFQFWFIQFLLNGKIHAKNIQDRDKIFNSGMHQCYFEMHYFISSVRLNIRSGLNEKSPALVWFSRPFQCCHASLIIIIPLFLSWIVAIVRMYVIIDGDISLDILLSYWSYFVNYLLLCNKYVDMFYMAVNQLAVQCSGWVVKWMKMSLCRTYNIFFILNIMCTWRTNTVQLCDTVSQNSEKETTDFPHNVQLTISH